MSVLEIVLYSLLGVGFVCWLIITIVTEKNKRKKGIKKDDEEEDLRNNKF